MNISEIAKMAGVSPAAVSRYLNQGYISAEKAEKIRRVIEETGYVPLTQARNLRTKRTGMIGVIIPKIDSETVSRMVSGIGQVLSAAGYEMILANTINNADKELEYLKIFSRNMVDGILFIATTMTKRHEELLKSIEIPVVMLGQKEPYVSCVFHDDFGAAKEVARTLLSGVHKKVAYLGVSMEDKAVGRARYLGFLEAAKEAGILEEEIPVEIAEFNTESGYLAAKKLLEKEPETNALFCAIDRTAVGALVYLRETGKKIPEDISVVGMDHIMMSQVVEPPLTTMHLHYKTCGMEGAKMLLEKLADPKTPVKQMELGYELVVQKSV